MFVPREVVLQTVFSGESFDEKPEKGKATV